MNRASSWTAGLALLLLSTGAQAGLVNVDVSDAESRGTVADPILSTVINIDLNAVLGFAPGGAVLVTGIGWDVIIETVGTSFLDEATVGFRDSADFVMLQLLPGFGSDNPGTANFASGGILDLTTAGPGGSNLSFMLDDGLLSLVFYEQFEDGGFDPDAVWLLGSEIIVQADSVVPAPATLLLMGAGLGGLLLRRRRRPI